MGWIGIIIAAVALLGLRIWWVLPQELPGNPITERVVEQGRWPFERSYSVYLKAETAMSDVVDTSLFEGYTPENHLLMKSRMLGQQPAKQVEEDYHSYTEFLGSKGRMQFYEEYIPQTGHESLWFEFIPLNMPVSRFFHTGIASNFDVPQDEFHVYIYRFEEPKMTVIIKGFQVDKIVWFGAY